MLRCRQSSVIFFVILIKERCLFSAPGVMLFLFNIVDTLCFGHEITQKIDKEKHCFVEVTLKQGYFRIMLQQPFCLL